MRVLLELRPAFDGYSGIPQETRLLLSGLTRMPGVQPVGLIQSNNLAVEGGLAPGEEASSTDARVNEARIDKLSRVVVSLHQGRSSHRFEHARKRLRQLVGPSFALLGSLLGRREPLGFFEPRGFEDFLWRSMFAKSLPADAFAAVTGGVEYRILRWPWGALHALGVGTSWLGSGRYLTLDTKGIDVVIAETPFPGRVRPPTQFVVRYHDAIPLYMPHTVKDRGYHRSAHFEALKRNARDGAWFACVSEATRRELLAAMPHLEPRTVTIPNMVSHHYRPGDEPASRAVEIVRARRNREAPNEGGAAIDPSLLRADGGLDYLLMVGTLEPRKNHVALVDAWEKLRASGHPRLHLVLVGSFGWHHEEILERMGSALASGGLHLLSGVPADDLCVLYRHAAATVCPSFGEGFDFPGIEAMRSGGVVAASRIAAHEDVFGDACAWFDAYDVDSLAGCLRGLLDEGEAASGRRRSLVEAGTLLSARYRPETIVSQWQAFLERIAPRG